jgi:DNA-binding transcriptional LysR family regulator
MRAAPRLIPAERIGRMRDEINSTGLVTISTSSGLKRDAELGKGSSGQESLNNVLAICRTFYGVGVSNRTMGISLIMSTRGVGLFPAYAQNFLPASVTSRPLKGDAPTVNLVLGYRKSNQSPILKLLLSRLDELVARVSKKTQ